MVSLWFAALFSLGSLAIRQRVLEDAVLALQIDLMVPAAAPPLGITARILLALAMFVIGALLGFVVARRLGRAKPEQYVRRRAPMAMARGERPVMAMPADPALVMRDDEDFERLAAARADQTARDGLAPNSLAHAGGRRALAMAEPEAPAAAEFAPQLVGRHAAPQILDLADLAIEQEAGVSADDIADDDIAADPQSDEYAPAHYAAADIAAAEELPAMEPEPHREITAHGLHRTFDAPGTADVIAPEPMFNGNPFTPVAPAEPAAEVAAVRPARDGAEKLRSAPLESLGVVQLAERLALAIARKREAGRDGADAASSTMTAIPQFSAPFAAPVADAPRPFEFQPAQPKVADAAPAHTGLPRLPVAAFDEADAPQVSVPSLEVSSLEVPSLEVPSLEVPGLEAVAAPVVPPVVEALVTPPPMPTALRPINFAIDDEDDEDEAQDSRLPPFSFARLLSAAPAPESQAPWSSLPETEAEAEAEAEAETEAVADDADEAESAALDDHDASSADAAEEQDYSSLLAIKPTQRQNFVRIEQPFDQDDEVEPVVIFPGQVQAGQTQAGQTLVGQTLVGQTQAGGRFSAPQLVPSDAAMPESPVAEPVVGFRRFDAPGATPVPMRAAAAAASGPISGVDPVETERALKAALATLQRMSGAA